MRLFTPSVIVVLLSQARQPQGLIVFGGGYRCNFGFFASIRLYVLAVILGIAGDRGDDIVF